MNIEDGKITQNGSWISYKTTIANYGISFYQKLADYFKEILETQGVVHDDNFEAIPRKGGAVTIKVFSKDVNMQQFPYESNSVE